MTHGELFSGCGGLTLGLERGTGARLAWHCQHDPDSRKQPCDEILERHWPGIPNLGDITAVDWHTVEPVDLLAGGFPCQDVSHAGLRAGLADGTRSGLWFQFAAAIRVLRPRVVVVENVPGLLTAGFGVVMADLAEAGYHARWACLRAADVGAPHGRERVFVVATDAERDGLEWPRGSKVEEERRNGLVSSLDRQASTHTEREWRRAQHLAEQRLLLARRGDVEAPADADRQRRPGAEHERGRHGSAIGRALIADSDSGRWEGVGEPEPRRIEGARGRLADGCGADRRLDDSAASADTCGEPGQPGRGRRAAGGADARAGQTERDGRGFDGPAEPGQAVEAAPDTDDAANNRERARTEPWEGSEVAWGVYEPAIRRWEHLTRPAPGPTDARGRLSPDFVEWMLGFPDGWTDGVTRTARLKMLGNAVQVQCAELVGVAAAHWLKETAA